MANKVQMTLTMDEEIRKYIVDLAESQFFGNSSMALQKIVTDHRSQKINNKSAE